MQLASGHTAEELPPDEMAQYMKDFTGSGRIIKLNPGSWVFPKSYLNFQEKLFNFKFRPDDVLIMTYPKCGTTWMQEIIWTMRNNPNLDNPDASTALFVRSAFIDMDMLLPAMMANVPEFLKSPIMQGFQKYCPNGNPKDGIALQIAEAVPGPRVIKTHLPFSLLSKHLLDTCKVIYVARNPKDALLSYQHHCRLITTHGFTGTQDEFVQYFVNDMLLWGSYAKHLKEATAKRDHPNLRIIFYEDMKVDILKELKNLDTFIGTGLTEQQLQNVKKNTSFSVMKANDPLKFNDSAFTDQKVFREAGPFMRQGQAGSWKGKFTPEQETKIDDWIKKNLAGLGLDFKYQ